MVDPALLAAFEELDAEFPAAPALSTWQAFGGFLRENEDSLSETFEIVAKAEQLAPGIVLLPHRARRSFRWLRGDVWVGMTPCSLSQTSSS